MAVVTSDYLAGVLTNFRALFENDFQAALAGVGWREFTSEIPSNGAENQYTWFGTVPKMVDITHGSPERAGLERFNFTIANLEFQAMLEVERAVLERDQLGLVRPRINQLGGEAARHPGELIFDLFETPGNAFDGTGFFADTRVIGSSANIDNQLAGTGTTIAQIQTDLGVARGAMRLFQDDQGRPMNLIGNVIVVPPAIEQAMWQALNTNQGDGVNTPALPATANGVVNASGYKIIVNPFLTDVNDWYLLHVSGDTKPFIFQSEKRPELLGGTNPNEQAVIESGKFLYAVNARYNVGVGDPRYAVKTTNT